MDSSTILFVIVVLAGGWVFQLAMAYRQARSFNQRVRGLTALGRTAVGRAGSRYRGFVFAALAVDQSGRVRGAEILKGVTVFARPRPAPQLIGSDLDELVHPGSKKTTDLAIADAASHLLDEGRPDEGGDDTA